MIEFEDTLTLVLREPIALGTAEYAQLELTEPNVEQLTASSKAGNAIEQLSALIQLNAKVPKAVVSKMLQRDLDRAGDFFAHFSAASPTTSET